MSQVYKSNSKCQVTDPALAVTPALDQGREERSESLPCLFSYNSIENIENNLVDHALLAANLLTNYHRKQALTLTSNVQRLIDLGPCLSHFGFLTLTTSDKCSDFRELSKRFDSLNTNYLKPSPDFGEWIRSTERHKSGALHYHFVVQLDGDISAGLDWSLWLQAQEAKRNRKPWRHLERKATKNVTPYLRERWAELRMELPKYGFGRSELLPIRTNIEAIAFYIGAYVGKHIGARKPEDLGIRLIVYSQNWLKNSPKFSWHNDNAQKWRENVQKFANYTIGYTGDPELDHYRLKQQFGSKWAYKYRDIILGFDKYIDENLENVPF